MKKPEVYEYEYDYCHKIYYIKLDVKINCLENEDTYLVIYNHYVLGTQAGETVNFNREYLKEGMLKVCDYDLDRSPLNNTFLFDYYLGRYNEQR